MGRIDVRISLSTHTGFTGWFTGDHEPIGWYVRTYQYAKSTSLPPGGGGRGMRASDHMLYYYMLGLSLMPFGITALNKHPFLVVLQTTLLHVVVDTDTHGEPPSAAQKQIQPQACVAFETGKEVAHENAA